MTAPRRARRIRDLFLYVVIATGVVASAFLFAAYQVRTGQTPGLPIKWLGFAAMTGLVFGDTIRATRHCWRNRRFWLLLSVFLAVQACLGIFLLSRVPKVPLVLYIVITPLNYAALSACLNFCLGSKQQ
jgi:hypothetical protein